MAITRKNDFVFTGPPFPTNFIYIYVKTFNKMISYKFILKGIIVLELIQRFKQDIVVVLSSNIRTLKAMYCIGTF